MPGSRQALYFTFRHIAIVLLSLRHMGPAFYFSLLCITNKLICRSLTGQRFAAECLRLIKTGRDSQNHQPPYIVVWLQVSIALKRSIRYGGLSVCRNGVVL